MENDKFRIKVPTDGISKLTSCNSLLCFHTVFPLLMVNPITREILELPKPWIEEEDEEASACVFGFDAKMNVYKVVQLKLCFSNSSLECEVLELGTTMSWRKIQHQPSFPCPDLGDPDEHPELVFVEGSIYWLASENILCFDVAAERLKLIPEPDHQKAQCCGNYNTFLVELDKSLCLMTHGISSGMVGIWKMQKDSVNEETTWIKSYSFSARRMIHNAINPYGVENIHIKSLCMRGKKIYLKYNEGLACYDTQRQKLIAPVFSRVADNNNLGAVAYTKSIVRLQDIVGSSTLRLCTV
ncbi:putative F-box protein At1g47790 [Papaver somniferum]|uniref:putative F-box protein At1g47790 n=1 Tax=Papaver somniferum TaxID=3469 RepID=UPI000E6FA714|nr:putative F-box protein At1g47790 [Papaver somniferum]